MSNLPFSISNNRRNVILSDDSRNKVEKCKEMLYMGKELLIPQPEIPVVGVQVRGAAWERSAVPVRCVWAANRSVTEPKRANDVFPVLQLWRLNFVLPVPVFRGPGRHNLSTGEVRQDGPSDFNNKLVTDSYMPRAVYTFSSSTMSFYFSLTYKNATSADHSWQRWNRAKIQPCAFVVRYKPTSPFYKWRR